MLAGCMGHIDCVQSDGRGKGSEGRGLRDWELRAIVTNLVDSNDTATLLGSFGGCRRRHRGASCCFEPPIDVVMCSGVNSLDLGILD
jgi:hypothetical protein